jgi:hypothetical protein
MPGIPASERLRQKDFELILVAWATQQDPTSNNQDKPTQNTGPIGIESF